MALWSAGSMYVFNHQRSAGTVAIRLVLLLWLAYLPHTILGQVNVSDPCGGCRNGGFCDDFTLESITIYHCECPINSSGNNCEFSACPQAYCGSDSICTTGSSTCNCSSNFTGHFCEIPAKELERCQTTFGCACVPEFGGRFCESDVVVLSTDFTFQLEYAFHANDATLLDIFNRTLRPMIADTISTRREFGHSSTSDRKIRSDSRGRLVMSYQVLMYCVLSQSNNEEILQAMLQAALFYNNGTLRIQPSVTVTIIGVGTQLDDLTNGLLQNRTSVLDTTSMAADIITSSGGNLTVSDINAYLGVLAISADRITNVNDIDSVTVLGNHVNAISGISTVEPSVLNDAREMNNFTTRLYTELESIAFSVPQTPTNSIPVNNFSGNALSVSADDVALVLVSLEDGPVSSRTGLQTVFFNFTGSYGANTTVTLVNGVAKLNNVEIQSTQMRSTPEVAFCASIFIPSEALANASILENCTAAELTSGSCSIRLAYTMYTDSVLFPDPSLEQLSGRIVTPVIAATMQDTSIDNLTAPVEVEFSRMGMEPMNDSFEHICMFWDALADEGYGAWSRQGCELANLSDSSIICHCTHLTNFAVLLRPRNINRNRTETSKKAMTIATYIGSGLSILALLALIIMHLAVRSLRMNVKSQVRCALAVNVLLLIVVFVAGIERREIVGVCRTVALLLHYFMLSVFVWLVVQGYTIYHKVCHSVEAYSQRSSKVMMLTYALIAQGLPLLIVFASAAAYWDAYYVASTSDDPFPICHMDSATMFLVAVVTPLALFLLINIFFFIRVYVVVWSKARNDSTVGLARRSNRAQLNQQVRAFLMLFILLGLTWISGVVLVVTGHDAPVWIFTVLLTLQGAFLFYSQCVDLVRMRQDATAHLPSRKSSMLSRGSRRNHSRASENDSPPPPRASVETELGMSETGSKGRVSYVMTRKDSGLGSDSSSTRASSQDAETVANEMAIVRVESCEEQTDLELSLEIPTCNVECNSCDSEEHKTMAQDTSPSQSTGKHLSRVSSTPYSKPLKKVEA